MSLYTRNHRPSMGMRTGLRIQAGEGLSRIMTDSPLSSMYVAPVKIKSTKLIWNYLVSIQTKQYGQTLNLSERTKSLTQAHIKQAFAKGYTPQYICRAVRYASTISRFPFSVPFAIRSLDESGCQFDRSRPDSQPDHRTTGVGSLWDS